MDDIKKYVITGGPGVGKTSLINILQSKGYNIIQEDAREIIKHQTQTNENGLPWKDKKLYSQLMFNASLKAYEKTLNEINNQIIFFDRGILDSICYMKMEDILIPEKLITLAKSKPYNQKVFLLPPWKEIYKTDDERKQTWNEALLTYNEIKKTYLDFGYEIIEVPKENILERCDFVLKHIK